MLRRNLFFVGSRKPISRFSRLIFGRYQSSVASEPATNDADLVKKCLQDWPGKYRIGINTLVRHINFDKEYRAKAKGRYIDTGAWSFYTNRFRRQLLKDPISFFQNTEKFKRFCELLELTFGPDGVNPLEEVENPSSTFVESLDKSKDYLFSLMIANAEKELSGSIESYKILRSSSDLRMPPEWYPYARMMKRKIIYHGGPTNSGKTHHALERLRNADPEKGGGLYCGPLRLLALEVYERLNRAGIITSLLTGQEKRFVPFSTHFSSTLEMVNINAEYDVAVIDEIQMISDSQRGYAWTRAVLGLRAREIHVCGGLEAEQLVRSLVEKCGDEFELIKYERLSELKVSETSLQGDYSKVQPGDCIVAFSRADIFSIRRLIEKMTNYKCAVIYGHLPSETRSIQARLFNEGKDYQILVASDAIGMGLNLNIKRVIFHTTLKSGGKNSGARLLEPSAVKQIGGRAGRHSSAYKTGEVTAWQDIDLAYIRAVMQWEIAQIPAAGVFPSVEQVQLFSEQLDNMKATQKNEVETDQTITENDDVIPNTSATTTIDTTTIDIDIDNNSSIDEMNKDTNTSLAMNNADDDGISSTRSNITSSHSISPSSSSSSSIPTNESNSPNDNDYLSANTNISIRVPQLTDEIIKLIDQSFDKALHDHNNHRNANNSFLYLSQLATELRKTSAGFSPSQYGYRSLRLLIEKNSIMKRKYKILESEDGRTYFVQKIEPNINSKSFLNNNNNDNNNLSQIINTTVADNAKAAALAVASKSRLSTLLERFADVAQIEGRYFLCEYSSILLVSNWLHTIPLTLAERFTFANAPVSTRDTVSMTMLYQYAATYALKRPVALNVRMQRNAPKDVKELTDLCARHNVLDLYIWLSLRFPTYFVEKDICLEQKAFVIQRIQSTLESSSLAQKFSHSAEYKKIRDSVKTVQNGAGPYSLPPDFLPQFSSVRATTEEYLAAIPKSKHYLFPHLHLETVSKDGDHHHHQNQYDNRNNHHNRRHPPPHHNHEELFNTANNTHNSSNNSHSASFPSSSSSSTRRFKKFSSSSIVMPKNVLTEKDGSGQIKKRIYTSTTKERSPLMTNNSV